MNIHILYVNFGSCTHDVRAEVNAPHFHTDNNSFISSFFPRAEKNNNK